MKTTHRIQFTPIGVIHSPFKEPAGTPIQSMAAGDISGTVEIFPEFSPGLEDLSGFSHILLIYHFHLVSGSSLKVKPFMDEQTRGVFATRAPGRPNPIGISLVELKSIEVNILTINGMDMLDNTPLLDLKPFVPAFDHRETDRIGWLAINVERLPWKKDDGRFTESRE